MDYIYLDELKELLPEILSNWIDEDDESWEWIFQKIEQKCYIGGRKRLKGKKWKKKMESNIDALSKVIISHRDDINELVDKVDDISELNKKFEYYEDALKKVKEDIAFLITRMRVISSEAKEAKFVTQTAKQRTEVDYSKYSGKSEGVLVTVEKVCSTCKHAVPMDAAHECPYLNDCCPYNMSHWEAKDE